jgi:ribosomal protein L32
MITSEIQNSRNQRRSHEGIRSSICAVSDSNPGNYIARGHESLYIIVMTGHEDVLCHLNQGIAFRPFSGNFVVKRVICY